MPASVPSGPYERLYDAVALGMWAYTRAAFRVVDLGGPRFEPRRGTLLVSSHRAETDVPLLCPVLYRDGRYFSDRTSPRVHFAARDDMFEQGFFAGFPPNLPSWARSFLFPLDAGHHLPRVRVHPVPYPDASTLRLGRALGELPPETPLDTVLPPELLIRIHARAREAGVRAPRTAGEALQGRLADVLWEPCTPEQLDAPALHAAWRRRAQESTAAIRQLVEIVASGEILLIFPEGRPSPDGGIGPLRKGLETIVRRGAPDAIVPIAVAYDAITPGRARAYVAFGRALGPTAGGADAVVLDALRRATPLTCGQVVAYELVRAASGGAKPVPVAALDAALAAACERAVANGRLADPGLLAVSRRRERLGEALAWVTRSGLATSDRRALTVVPERVLADPTLRRAAAEYASANGILPTTAPPSGLRDGL